MPSETSLEAVNTAGPFVSGCEVAQQTGIAYPRIRVLESVGAGRGKVPIQIHVPNFWTGS